MVDILTAGGPGKGIYFAPVILPMTVRVAASAGDVLVCDTTFTDGDVADNDEGQSDSGLANMIVPITATLVTGYFGVVLKDTPIDSVAQVLFKGRVELKTTGTPANNIQLVAANGVITLAAVGGSGLEKIIAHTLQLAAGSPEKTIAVFDGINGFGRDST